MTFVILLLLFIKGASINKDLYEIAKENIGRYRLQFNFKR